MIMFFTTAAVAATTATKLLMAADIAIAIAPVCTALHTYISEKKASRS